MTEAAVSGGQMDGHRQAPIPASGAPDPPTVVEGGGVAGDVAADDLYLPD